jgi:DNA-binding transcriptional ArsR family regulator
LKELANAGMVESRQDGRFVFYSANYDQMNGLLGYLTENCCQGKNCMTESASQPQLKRKRA